MSPKAFSSPQPDAKASTRTGAIRFAFGCVVLAVILMLPSHPGRFSSFEWMMPPLELAALAGLLFVVGRGSLFKVCLLLTSLVAAVLLFLKLADIGTFSAFGRPFNPWLDAIILTDGWNLLSGAIGHAQALAIVAGALTAWAATILVLSYGLAGGAKMRSRARLVAFSAISIFALGSILTTAYREDAASISLETVADNAAYLSKRVSLIQRSAVDLATFELELQSDPLDERPADASLFSALEGRDVYFLFVESYGRTVLTDPAYRARIEPRLQDVEAKLAGTGYSARSGWLTSPTVGGQSWLAHGALLSGLETTDQNRYDRMIASERKTLNHLFRDAGWHTIAVMPAITRDWPEGGYYGYDAIYASDDLGYNGLPFNWVTMPDQYTLSATKQIVDAATKPVMAEVALISSHAPWTPIAELVPWDEVGDGTIFDEQAMSGETPKFVWAEPERIRDHFVRAIDYALATMGSFVEEHGGDAVFVVVGDHQPARLLTGDNATRDVPLHIIANDEDLLDRLGGLDLTPGMEPNSEGDVQPMWAFREAFTRAMSGGDETASAR